MSNLSEFLARELREPTPEEMADIRRRDLEERRQREAERHEAEVKRAYLAQPGSDEAGWQRDRTALLAETRKQDAIKQRDAARDQITLSYRRSF